MNISPRDRPEVWVCVRAPYINPWTTHLETDQKIGCVWQHLTLTHEHLTSRQTSSMGVCESTLHWPMNISPRDRPAVWVCVRAPYIDPWTTHLKTDQKYGCVCEHLTLTHEPLTSRQTSSMGVCESTLHWPMNISPRDRPAVWVCVRAPYIDPWTTHLETDQKYGCVRQHLTLTHEPLTSRQTRSMGVCESTLHWPMNHSPRDRPEVWVCETAPYINPWITHLETDQKYGCVWEHLTLTHEPLTSRQTRSMGVCESTLHWPMNHSPRDRPEVWVCVRAPYIDPWTTHLETDQQYGCVWEQKFLLCVGWYLLRKLHAQALRFWNTANRLCCLR